MKISYFVTYLVNKYPRYQETIEVSCCEIRCDPITGFDVIATIIELIRASEKLSNDDQIVILNWQRFEKGESK
ncbi:MAG: hypothetical protein ACWGQW_19610 [bacterium]